jgi:hypothetical protein
MHFVFLFPEKLLNYLLLFHWWSATFGYPENGSVRANTMQVEHEQWQTFVLKVTLWATSEQEIVNTYRQLCCAMRTNHKVATLAYYFIRIIVIFPISTFESADSMCIMIKKQNSPISPRDITLHASWATEDTRVTQFPGLGKHLVIVRAIMLKM